MLDYFKELRNGYPDIYNSEFILWNNKEITIASKTLFWKHPFQKGICFVHDLLDNNDNFLSLENVQLKFKFKYAQPIAAITGKFFEKPLMLFFKTTMGN